MQFVNLAEFAGEGVHAVDMTFGRVIRDARNVAMGGYSYLRTCMPNRIPEIESVIAAIDGWLHPQAGASLYQLARQHLPALAPHVVELGSWKGRSTAWLGFSDAAAYTRNLEAAYREMWKRWIAEK